MYNVIIQHQPQLSDLTYYNYTGLDDYITFSDKTPLPSYRTYRVSILQTRKKLYNLNDLRMSRIYDDVRPISSYKQRKYDYTGKKYHPISSQYLLIRGGSS